MEYEISVTHVESRPIAVVHHHMKLAELAQGLRPLYDCVYEMVRRGRITQGGHNLVVYRGEADELDVEVGIEVAERFDSTGGVVCLETPGG